jgi:hypothetical protein
MMTAGLLRQYLGMRPFRPCRLILAGGHVVPVASPDCVWIRDAETVEVRTPDGYRHIIDLAHLVEIKS